MGSMVIRRRTYATLAFAAPSCHAACAVLRSASAIAATLLSRLAPSPPQQRRRQAVTVQRPDRIGDLRQDAFNLPCVVAGDNRCDRREGLAAVVPHPAGRAE